MASLAINSYFSASSTSFLTNSSNISTISSHPCLHTYSKFSISTPTYKSKIFTSNPKTNIVVEEQKSQTKVEGGVEESVKVLKNAAKTRKVKADEVLGALSVIKNSKLDSSPFLETLGGNESPGKTWMLIFTTQDGLKRGSYFPITAIQRFNAAAKRIENGVYLGPLGCLTFEGKFSWKQRILAFIFERVRIKLGPFNPLEISLGQNQDKEPSTKDPFFIWFYVDEEIAVAQGKGGGTAFWCRCKRVT